MSGTTPQAAPISVDNNHPGTSTESKGSRIRPSSGIFITFAVVAILFVIVFIIRKLVRCCCRNSQGSSYRLPIIRTSSNGDAANTNISLEHERLKLIESLPLVTLASSMAKLPKSSRDCAVCCEPFLPDAVLRLLPACCHAFHKLCVDQWLKANPTCPLCRSSITIPQLPLLDLSSGSFRIEVGNVSLRRSESNSSQIQTQVRPLPPLRTYSLETHDYHIEEQIEIVQLRRAKSLEKRGMELSGIPLRPRRPRRSPPPPSSHLPLAQPPTSPLSPPQPPPPPSSHLLPAEPPTPPPSPPQPPPRPSSRLLPAQPPSPPPPPPPPPPLRQPPIGSLIGEERERGWLQEYLDKLSSAASSSFNSMRFPSQRWSGRWSGRWSQRSSQRFDSDVGGGPPPDTWLWDLESGQNEAAGVDALFAENERSTTVKPLPVGASQLVRVTALPSITSL